MALTSWRPHREGQVRTRKESDQERVLHQLETASGGGCQDTKRKQVSEGNSLSGNRIRRDKSGNGKETERGEPTFWRPHQEGYVTTRKESDRAKGTHFLETPSGQISQNTESDGAWALTFWRPHQEGEVRTRKEKRPSEGHTHSGDRIGRDKSGRKAKEIKRRALTSWRSHREG